MYGKELFDFVKSILKENFLYAKRSPYLLTWDVNSDEDDNYLDVCFYDGKFEYRKHICGGYAGVEVLESDISKERVIELIHKIEK